MSWKESHSLRIDGRCHRIVQPTVGEDEDIECKFKSENS